MPKTLIPYGKKILAPEYCVNDFMAEFGNEKRELWIINVAYSILMAFATFRLITT